MGINAEYVPVGRIARENQTYPALVRRLCALHEIEVVRAWSPRGGKRILSVHRFQVPNLVTALESWLARPKLPRLRPGKAAPRAR